MVSTSNWEDIQWRVIKFPPGGVLFWNAHQPCTNLSNPPLLLFANSCTTDNQYIMVSLLSYWLITGSGRKKPPPIGVESVPGKDNCLYCGKPYSPQGMTTHVKVHQANGDKMQPKSDHRGGVKIHGALYSNAIMGSDGGIINNEGGGGGGTTKEQL